MIFSWPKMFGEKPIINASYPYPSSPCVWNILPYSNARQSFIRLWLTEGVPQLFSQSPELYDGLRVWLGKKIGVYPRDIIVVGSAKLGYSINLRKCFGTPFNCESDLDINVVSSCLFEMSRIDFFAFKEDYENNKIIPKGPKQRKNWKDNSKRGIKNLNCGFLDVTLIIPLRKDSYPTVYKISNAQLLLNRVFFGYNEKNKIHIRVHRDWESLIKQTGLNLTSK